METAPEWKSITSFRRVEKNDIQQCSGDFNKNRSIMSVAEITTTTAKECSGGSYRIRNKSFGRPANRRNRLGVLLVCSGVLGGVGAPDVQVFVVARRHHGDLLFARHAVQS